MSFPRFWIATRAPLAAIWLMLSALAFSEDEPTNTDESKVPAYTLPDPLKATDGKPVKTEKEWRGGRRAEILELFRMNVYGRSPAPPKGLAFEKVSEDRAALGGLATRRIVAIRIGSDANVPNIPLEIYIPNKRGAPAPVFVGIHLFDRAAPHPQPGKLLADSIDEKDRDEAAKTISFAALPGDRAIEAILERGYAIATMDAKDIAPDKADDYRNGVIHYLNPAGDGPPGPEEWGTIGAWAWSLSRALDYFQTDPDLDARRAIAIGHSRMGKTALWAAAQDERFAMAVSNNSGCGGAALSKRIFGETVGHINRGFPHWFCGNFKGYARKEVDLPVDQHELLALIAPRPTYVASAERDSWADPKGEFLACVAAEPVWKLFGATGIGTTDPPPTNQPIGEMIGYHRRSGKHALTDYDWLRYMDFADRRLGKP